ncbi:hypothetical protein TS71_03865 [Mycolicibacterium neoaurum]|uniref:Uncharacterized protein n=1 Tax=Mycolicibacterium neoaurum VKM Ac-1815D TaxID=700508 RepID=V5XHB5_MYCNE|nr:hypothetical protein D174_05720 [Mycolicibacterium neoaurum VKM Ac-1815D]AMO04751.1 hypothetical protein MyAD_05610 [Mycolicibacterium neoaurum]KJQ51863.1 hypothetical protein TS71_03865 [Mycolicibacterium neoaurum]
MRVGGFGTGQQGPQPVRECLQLAVPGDQFVDDRVTPEQAAGAPVVDGHVDQAADRGIATALR